MPYFDPHKYFIDPTQTPLPNEIGIGINYKKPSTLQDIIKNNGE